MALDDLLPLKGKYPINIFDKQQVNTLVQPAPLNKTGIPQIINLFKTEWDSTILEMFTLKKHLQIVR